MKTIKTGLFICAGLMVCSSGAFADHKNHHDRVEYEQSAYARVLEVTPVYKEVRVSQPVQKCWQQPLSVHHPVQRDYSSAGSALAGGLLGGIIGHQIGGGRGNKLATALGTIIGAQAGHHAGSGLDAGPYDQFMRYEEICEVESRSSIQEIADGYNVKYRYNGNSYLTHMPYRPGPRIKVNVSVNPVF